MGSEVTGVAGVQHCRDAGRRPRGIQSIAGTGLLVQLPQQSGVGPPSMLWTCLLF